MAHEMAQKDNADRNNGGQSQMDPSHFQTHSAALQSVEWSEALCRSKWQKHHGNLTLAIKPRS